MDNAKDLGVVMPMYNLIEYSNSYSKASGSLYQFCGDEPNNIITSSEWFKFKSKFLDNTNNNASIINVKIAVPLKYLSNFCRTLVMPLISCEINLILTFPVNCVISEGSGVTAFAITDTKLYVPVVTLSTQGNTKLLERNQQLTGRNINQK